MTSVNFYRSHALDTFTVSGALELVVAGVSKLAGVVTKVCHQLYRQAGCI